MSTIQELTPDSRNANKGNQRGTGMLEDSLRKHGAGRSILADKNGRIIAGNKTLEGAAAIGMEDTIVVKSDGSKLVVVQRTDLDLDDPKARELAIADNRIGQVNLEWDAGILAELAQEGVDLADLWNANELDELLAGINGPAELLTDPDAIPESVEPRVKVGDLFRLGEHRLLCGDSTKREDVERLMGGEKADCVVTDPPYGMAFQSNYRKTGHDAISGDGDEQLLLHACNLDARHSNYVWCRWNNIPRVPSPKSIITWAKNNWSMGDLEHEHARQTEVCLFYPGPSHKWPGQRPTDLVTHDRTHNELHPTEKPVSLLAEVIGWTEGVLYDPFLGSGTTLIAAEQLGRKCYGIEIEPKYCDVIIARWEQATGKTAELVKTGRKVHDPTPRKVLVNATPRPTIKKTNGKTNKVHTGNG